MRAAMKAILRRLHLLGLARGSRQRARMFAYLRRNLPYWLRGAPDRLPLPPLKLITLATGQPDIHWYLEGGQLAESAIREALEGAGASIERFRAVLDFGCGSGRVFRRWSSISGPRFCGCDYNPALVRWCAERLPFGEFCGNQLAPPMSFPTQSFDFIYALSVFTHMPARLQVAWIEELRRILIPGGYLLLSTHGERYLDDLTREEQDQFRSGRLVVKYDDVAGSNTCGAYHPAAYVRAELSVGFDLLTHLPEGARGNPHQDLYLLRKPNSPRLP